LEELERTYKGKITGEVDRYDKLIATREVVNQEFDKANAVLIAGHQRHVATIVSEHEARVKAEEVRWGEGSHFVEC